MKPGGFTMPTWRTVSYTHLPGGVVAFVTSRYTMDAKDSTVRRYLAQRAELLGAIRLQMCIRDRYVSFKLEFDRQKGGKR